MYAQAKDPNNPKGQTRFFEHYKDAQGRRRTVSVTMERNTTATRKEAARLLRERIGEALTAQGGPEHMTLGALIVKYIEYQRAIYKESTVIQNEMQLEWFVKNMGDVKPGELTAGAITEALNYSEKPNTWKNGKLKHLKALMRWAYSQEYVENIDSVERVRPWPETSAREKVREKYLEREELAALLDGMAHEEWRRLTRLLALSGLRIGEAMALTLDDVDLAGKALTVSKTYSLNARRIQSTKTTTSDRVLHLRPELLETVRECVVAAREKALAYGFRPRLLFADTEGGYISYEAYSKYFRENTERIVGRRLSVHSLRHTYTSLMAEAGLPLDTISRTLGHADSKITREIYLHVTEKMREQDAARLDAVSLLG
jgi:integrase